VSNTSLVRELGLEAEWEEFIASGICPPQTMNFYQLDGYLRGISTAPGKITLDAWLPLVFNDQEPSYQDAKQRDRIFSNLLNLHKFHIDQVSRNLCDLPCALAYARLQEERVDLEQWARGFLQGYIVRDEAWNQALIKATDSQIEHKIGAITLFDDLDAIITIVSTVADAKYAVETGTNPDDLVAIFESLPDSIVRCGYLGRRLDEQVCC
jgi:uncharacterized protein